jgi:hypothetical protein
MKRTCGNCRHDGRQADGTPNPEACALMEGRDDVTRWAWAHWEAGTVDPEAPECPGFAETQRGTTRVGGGS